MEKIPSTECRISRSATETADTLFPDSDREKSHDQKMTFQRLCEVMNGVKSEKYNAGIVYTDQEILLQEYVKKCSIGSQEMATLYLGKEIAEITANPATKERFDYEVNRIKASFLEKLALVMISEYAKIARFNQKALSSISQFDDEQEFFTPCKNAAGQNYRYYPLKHSILSAPLREYFEQRLDTDDKLFALSERGRELLKRVFERALGYTDHKAWDSILERAHNMLSTDGTTPDAIKFEQFLEQAHANGPALGNMTFYNRLVAIP